MLAETAGNDPFFAEAAREFLAMTRKRHPKMPWWGRFEFGVALCVLPQNTGGYAEIVEPSARRNYKKAIRLGYEFKRIEYNRHLQDIADIRRSASVRQGPMPDELLSGPVTACRNPASRTDIHDYPFFGIICEGRVYAYADCLVAGEAVMIEHLFGHAAHQADGIVPMLLIGMADHIRTHYPRVKYYIYDTYFGASPSLRRFKKKFGFIPRRVVWTAG